VSGMRKVAAEGKAKRGGDEVMKEMT